MNEAAQQTAQALEEQKEHLEQVKEASLSAQEQILRQEFEQRFQHTVLEQDWLPRAEYLGAMRHQKEALEVNHQEAMERSEAEIRELQLQISRQVTNFTDRMLADLPGDRDRIFTRIDEMVPILKAMVAIELRQKPERSRSRPSYPPWRISSTGTTRFRIPPCPTRINSAWAGRAPCGTSDELLPRIP
jgi:hypothetical protein